MHNAMQIMHKISTMSANRWRGALADASVKNSFSLKVSKV